MKLKESKKQRNGEKQSGKKEKIKKDKKPKKDKKEKKGKKTKKGKKLSKGKLISRIVGLAIFIALLFIGYFLLFGGDKVPEKIQSIKGYSAITQMAKEKVPENFQPPIKLPFELPFNLSAGLPFSLPTGDSEIPDKAKIKEDILAYQQEGAKEEEKSESEGEAKTEGESEEAQESGGHGEAKAEGEGEAEGEAQKDTEGLEIEKRITSKERGKDIVYAALETTDAEGKPVKNYYKMFYKKRMLGGWKLDEILPYNVIGVAESPVGVSNEIVLKDVDFNEDMPEDWKVSGLKVLGHHTDMKNGTDTVVVYMEIKNSYVFMEGGRDVTYKFNEDTKTWEKHGVLSKFNCTSMEMI